MKILDYSYNSPWENIACDEVLLAKAEAGSGGEVLRFWEASQTFVVLGYGNQAGREVDLEACRAMGIPIFRRCSGGGTVLQGPGCLNYALILKMDGYEYLRSASVANHYIMSRNKKAVASHLRGTIQIQGHTDLTQDNMKFSGNAQRRGRTHLLFHGTFLTGMDLTLMDQLLAMPSREPDYRRSRPHSQFIKNLKISSERIKQCLMTEWKADHDDEE